MQVLTLPTAQATPALTETFSRGHDPFTRACKARPLTIVGWTSLSVSLSFSLSLTRKIVTARRRAARVLWEVRRDAQYVMPENAKMKNWKVFEVTDLEAQHMGHLEFLVVTREDLGKSTH